MLDTFFLKLVHLRKAPILGKLSHFFSKVPRSGNPRRCRGRQRSQIPPLGMWSVIHQNTVIEDNLSLYQGVTIGRPDIYTEAFDSGFSGIRICERGDHLYWRKGSLFGGSIDSRQI